MGNINRVPLGLLSLLDSQTQGQAPATLVDTVQGNFDLAGLWFNAKGAETVQASAAAQIITGLSNVRVSVPEGEMWAVISASCKYFALDAVGAVSNVDLLHFPNQNAALFNALTLARTGPATPNFGGVTGIISAVANWSPGDPFYVRAGGYFGAYPSLGAPLIAGMLPEVSVLFYRLKI